MSDIPHTEKDDIVALANEYNRLQRQLESKSARLDALLAVNAEAGDFPTDFGGAHNRRYSIDFNFQGPIAAQVGGLTPGDMQPQERSVTIESGTIFRCAYMESFLRVIATAQDPYNSVGQLDVQATLPWNQRLQSFDYFWRVRDTGTDREWVDHPQPSMFGGGGYVGPLWFPRRVIMSGGTVLYATVAPFLNRIPPLFFFSGNNNVKYALQMSFVGHEVPAGGDL